MTISNPYPSNISDNDFSDFDQNLCREAETELGLRNIKLSNWQSLEMLGIDFDFGPEAWDISALWAFGDMPLNPDAVIRVGEQNVCQWNSVAETLKGIDEVFDGAQLPEKLIFTGLTFQKGEPTCREDYWGDMQANFAQI